MRASPFSFRLGATPTPPKAHHSLSPLWCRTLSLHLLRPRARAVLPRQGLQYLWAVSQGQGTMVVAARPNTKRSCRRRASQVQRCPRRPRIAIPSQTQMQHQEARAPRAEARHSRSALARGRGPSATAQAFAPRDGGLHESVPGRGAHAYDSWGRRSGARSRGSTGTAPAGAGTSLDDSAEGT